MRIDGYRKKLGHEYRQWRHRRDDLRAEDAFKRYLNRLSKAPLDVLVGANFASFGGVRGHIQAIKKHSNLRVEITPPDSLLASVGAHRLQGQLKGLFWDLNSATRVVHSHVFPWFIDWCYHKKQTAGVHWIHTYHLNYYPEHGRNGGLEPWQKDINDALIDRARHADICLSVSRWQVEELRQLHGIEARYLPNGVDVVACDKGNAHRFQRKHQLEDFVLYVGRNEPVKNPSEFVLLARRLPETVFVMIGGGLSHQALTDCEKEPLPKNLKILGGLSPAEVQDAIAACSLLVVTSKREGLPTLVLEAMAHQVPVLVPDEAGCLEAIDQGKFGWVYRLGDIEDLAYKAREAPRDRARSSAARQHVLKEYDWRVVGRELDGIYAKVMSLD